VFVIEVLQSHALQPADTIISKTLKCVAEWQALLVKLRAQSNRGMLLHCVCFGVRVSYV